MLAIIGMDKRGSVAFWNVVVGMKAKRQLLKRWDLVER